MKIIVASALSIVFIVSAVTSVFSAGRLLQTGFEAALGVTDCYYVTKPTGETACEVDYNNMKRNVASSAALFVVSLPLAYFLYRKVWSLRKDA